MSVFEGREVLASVYEPDDSVTSRETTYPAQADFTIKMHIIRRAEDTILIMGQEAGEYVANINGDYANADRVVRGVKVVANGETYIVINKVRYNATFNKYKVLMNTFA